MGGGGEMGKLSESQGIRSGGMLMTTNNSYNIFL